MMRRLIIWGLTAAASITLTILIFLPATWLAAMLEMQTAGRLTLGDARGTLWRGSGFIGGAPSKNEPITALLPGRFSWRLSPLLLLGSVDIELDNPEALSQTVSVTGSWHRWKVSPAVLFLPSEQLAALGAPLNTVQPSGQIRLSWEPLQLELLNGRISVNGTMKLEMNDIASRLSPVKPLGSYEMTLAWSGLQADMKLTTVRGPMLLNGSGVLSLGHLQFSGKAESDAGHDQALANFLNLLGQRRKEGDKDVIALEFK